MSSSSTPQSKQLALCSASKEGRIEDVRYYLKDATIDVNYLSHHGWSALHLACCKNHCDIAELLLDHGANIELRASFLNFTPLITASLNGSLSIVKLLLERGANVHSQDKDGSTPLHHACTPQNVDDGKQIVQALLAHGADPNLTEAASHHLISQGTMVKMISLMS